MIHAYSGARGQILKQLNEKRIELFRRVCLEQGVRVTPQRLEIFLEIMSAEDHPSAEDIFRRVRSRMPTVSLDTVYRTLNTLDYQGLIRKVRFLEDKARFDPNTDLHHHLICSRCGGVSDFYWPALDAFRLPPEAERWGRVDVKHVQVRGVCAKCLSEEESGVGKGDQSD